MNTNQNITLPINGVPTHIVVWQESHPSVGSSESIKALEERIESLEKLVKELLAKTSPSCPPPSGPLAPHNSPRIRTVSDILRMNRISEDLMPPLAFPPTIAEGTPNRSPYFTATRVPEPVGLGILHLSSTPPRRLSTHAESEAKLFEEVVSALKPDPLNTAVIGISDDSSTAGLSSSDKEEKVEEEQVEEEQVEEEQVEEEQVEEEQEVAMELEEFDYKGVTYYKDAENQVYELDENGDLNDTPIGVWNEVKQKLLKYPKN